MQCDGQRAGHVPANLWTKNTYFEEKPKKGSECGVLRTKTSSLERFKNNLHAAMMCGCETGVERPGRERRGSAPWRVRTKDGFDGALG